MKTNNKKAIINWKKFELLKYHNVGGTKNCQKH